MKKRIPALLLAAAFCITLGLAAGVDSPPLSPQTAPAEKSATGESAAPADKSAAGESAAPQTAPQTAPTGNATAPAGESAAQSGGKTVTLSFPALERTVRQNNLTIKANDQTLQGIETMSYDTMEIMYDMNMEALVRTKQSLLDAMAELRPILDGGLSDKPSDAEKILARSLTAYLQSAVAGTQQNIGALEQQIKSLDATVDDMDTAYATAKKQMQSVADQLTLGAQSLYLSLSTLDLQQQDLQRTLSSLDRTAAEMQTRFSLGQISEMQLLQVQNQRAQLAGSLESLKIQMRGLTGDLALLAGYDPAVTVSRAPLPAATVGTPSYDADLKLAIKNSYTLYAKNDAMRKASNDYEDNVTSTLHTYNAAKLSYQAAEQQLQQSFRKLYDALGDKQRQLAVAQENEALQQRLYTVAATKYERGMVSKNALQTAKDDYAAAQNSSKKAEIDLFTAVNQYDWAKKGVMG